MYAHLKSSVAKTAVIATTILSLIAAPAIVYADASAPMAMKHKGHKHHARMKPHARHKAVARRAPAEPAPQQVAEVPQQPVYTPPPEPTPAPAPVAEAPPAPAPTPAPAPVVAHSGSSWLLPLLGVAAVAGGIIAATTGKSKSP
jgi:hypothetical protein